MSKQRITKVEILWSENGTFQRRYGDGPVVFDSMEKANRLLAELSHTAPGPGGGYDKTDFRVTWEDGQTYQGRYDLHGDGCKQENPSGLCDLGDHMRAHLTFYAGLRRPSHMAPEDYADLLSRCDEKHKQEAREMLDKYSLE